MKITEQNNEYTISGTVECEDCKGTGLYQGFAEKDGARVVCYKCSGKGSSYITLKFKKFNKRKIDKECKRVYSNGMGYVITDKDIMTEKGFFPFSKYGCSYEEWLNGITPKHLEFLGCPYQATNQDLQCKDKNNLYATRCKGNLGWGMISKCNLFPDKEVCWKIYKGEK